MAGRKVGSIYTEIRAKLDKLEKDFGNAHRITKRSAANIQSSLDKITFSKMTSGIKSIGVAWSGFMAIFAGAGTIGAFGKLATDYENSIFQLSKTFGKNSDYMIATARRVSEATNKYYNFSQVSYALTKTADSMQRYGITGERYLNLVSRAADIGAAKGLELRETIDRIESAMRGEAEASEYLGVTLNDTYMKNKAFGGSLYNTWEKLTDNQKAMYRYNELLIQTEKYQGAAEEASNTLSGSFKSLWNTIRDRLNPSLKESAELLSSVAVGLREMLEVKEGESGIEKQLKGVNEQIRQIEAHHDWLNKAGVPIGFGAMMGGKSAPELDALKEYALDLNALAQAVRNYNQSIAGGPPVPAGSGDDSKERILKATQAHAAALEKSREIGTDFWLTQAKDRTDVIDRTLEYEIEAENRAANEKAMLWEDKYGPSFWEIQAQERYEVQSRSLDALIEAEQKNSGRMIELTERTAEAMQRNFSDLFFDTMQGKFKNFSDYMNALFTSIQRAWADLMGQMAAQWAFGNDFKGGAIQSAISSVGNYFGGSSSYAPAHVGAGGTTAFRMASGGHLGEGVLGVGKSSGKSYEFHPNESVIPDSKMGGGGSITVYNITAMDTKSFVDFARRTGAIPLLASENLAANGVLRKSIMQNL